MTARTDLAWLAGWVDGEGAIGMTRKVTAYCPVFQASTTDRAAADNVTRIVSEVCGYAVQTWGYEERDPAKHKDAIHIAVTGMARLRPLLNALVPFLVTKRRQAELVIEFMSIRLEMSEIGTDGRIRRGGNYRKPYGQREHDIYWQLRELNARGPRAASLARQRAAGIGRLPDGERGQADGDSVSAVVLAPALAE